MYRRNKDEVEGLQAKRKQVGVKVSSSCVHCLLSKTLPGELPAH
jgi:hypothetical protein